MTVNYVTMS